MPSPSPDHARHRAWPSRRRLALFALVLLVVLADLAVLALVRSTGPAAVSRSAYLGSKPPPGVRLPPFVLRDTNGGLVDSAHLRRRVVVVTFLDSKCRSLCPIVAGLIASGVDQLRPSERANVAVLAISVDPGLDTPASVHAFLAARRATGRIRWLVDSRAALRPVWRAFHILSAVDSGNVDTHSSLVEIYRSGQLVTILTAGADLSAQSFDYDVRLALA